MPFPPDATLAEVGEFGLIGELSLLFGQGEQVLVGPGTTPRCCASAEATSWSPPTWWWRDGTSAGTGPRRPTSGHRAAAQNLSDINAMGGRAHSLTIGLAAPGELPARWALEFARGLRRRVRPRRRQRRRRRPDRSRPGRHRGDGHRRLHPGAGAPLRRPARRRPGDTGRQGWAAGGLAVLSRGFRSPRVLVEAYRRPEPPYAAGPEAAEAGATSMIDVSDGLLADAGHLARASGVAIDVRTARSRCPSRCTRWGPPPVRTPVLHARRRRGPLAAGHLPRDPRCPRAGRRSGRRGRGRGGHRRRGGATTARPAGPTSEAARLRR